jgi:hypothetical protein
MSTLYVKVSVARRPNSGKPRAIRIVASYDQRPTKNSVQWYAELGFGQLTDATLHASVRKLVNDARAAHVSLDVKNEVYKMM